MTNGTSGSALTRATIIGTEFQLVMVVCGHHVEFIKLNVLAIAGAVWAVIGIAVSFGLGDVAAMIGVVDTLSSTVGGAIGGAVAGGKK